MDVIREDVQRNPGKVLQGVAVAALTLAPGVVLTSPRRFPLPGSSRARTFLLLAEHHAHSLID
jgi:hypothetical protein